MTGDLADSPDATARLAPALSLKLTALTCRVLHRLWRRIRHRAVGRCGRAWLGHGVYLRDSGHLQHPDCVDGSRTHNAVARRGRLLHLGTRVSWSVLGSPRSVVDLSCSVMLLACFPVLFVSYLSYLVPWIAPSADVPGTHSGMLVRWIVALLVIVSAMTVNLRGTRDVGRSAIIAAAFVIGTFLLPVVVGFDKGPSPANAISLVTQDLAAGHPRALLLGLSLSILNYGGGDNISTYASEVDRPQRNYPLALGGALLLAVVGYALPVLAPASPSLRIPRCGARMRAGHTLPTASAARGWAA